MVSARYRPFDTPVGTFVLVTDEGELSAGWRDLGDDDGLVEAAVRDDALEPVLSGQLERYFAGEPVKFERVTAPAGPPFVRRCWEACRKIPRGTTVTYGELAAAAGNPRGARAA